MSELAPETQPGPPDLPENTATPPAAVEPARGSTNSGNQVAIAAIIAIAVVTLCCIVACAVVAFAFMNNPPW